MSDLTGFQLDCPVIIAGHEPFKGLAIKNALDEYYGFEVNHVRLYPNRDKLGRIGFDGEGPDGRLDELLLAGGRGREVLAERYE